MPWSAEVHAHRTREARRQARLEARGGPAEPQGADASLLSLVAVAGACCSPLRLSCCGPRFALKLGTPLQGLWRPAWRGSERGTSCGRTAWSAGRWSGPGSIGTYPGGSLRPPCGQAPQRSSAPRRAPALGLCTCCWEPAWNLSIIQVLTPKACQPCHCKQAVHLATR